MSKTYYLGWDVGAWHCNAQRSQDAIVILEEGNNDGPLGNPFWGNLKDTIRESKDATKFLEKLFTLCNLNTTLNFGKDSFILAIDAPLGFPVAVKNLLNGNIDDIKPLKANDKSIKNRLLYRETERNVFKNCIVKNKDGEEKAKKPLSLIQDSIGSQATKAMYLLKKLKMESKKLGIWGLDNLTIIETYPAACYFENNVKKKKIKFKNINTNKQIKSPDTKKRAEKDVKDAFKCAKVAEAFANEDARLVRPDEFIESKQDEIKDIETIIKAEGWIWYLKDKAKIIQYLPSIPFKQALKYSTK